MPHTPSDWPAFEVDQANAITAALDEATRRNPSLHSLRALIPPSLEITQAFVDAYIASPILAVHKSFLFRALLADPSAFVPSTFAVVGPAVLTRLITWWEARGELDGRGGSLTRVPASICRALALPRTTSVTMFTSTHVLAPWWGLRTGRREMAGYMATWPTPPDAARRVLAGRTLRADDARVVMAGDEQELLTRTEWFFADSGIPGLDLRNAFVFMAVALRDRDGGRVQNRLPVMLTRRWGLRRISVPDVLAFADVATLACSGVLHPTDDDPLGLNAILHSPHDVRLATGADDPEAAEAFRINLGRWVLTEPEVLRREAMRLSGKRDGTYDTGFCFNVDRLTYSHPELSRFAPYYAQTDGRALHALLAPHWPAGVSAQLRAVKDHPAAQGIQARGLGNILATLRVLDVPIDDTQAVGHALPTVARIALGADDQRDHHPGKGRSTTKLTSHGTNTSVPRWKLPIFEALMADLRSAPAIEQLVTLHAPRLAAQLLMLRGGSSVGPELASMYRLLGLSAEDDDAAHRVTTLLLTQLASVADTQAGGVIDT